VSDAQRELWTIERLRAEDGEWVYDSFDGKVKGFQTHRIYAAKLVENCVQGIAAALAMPPAPFLPVGHAYVGIQEGEYDGQFATGVRGTYQITRSLNANVGVSGGSGLYGHVAVTAGMGYEFGG